MKPRLSFVCSFIRSSVCLFVRLSPPQALSGLKYDLLGLKSALSDPSSVLSGLKFALSGLESALLGRKSALSGLESALSDSRPGRADFRPEAERADEGPQRADFRPKRAWGGQTDRRTNEQTNGSPLCSTGLCPLRGRCPASPILIHNHAKQGNGTCYFF